MLEQDNMERQKAADIIERIIQEYNATEGDGDLALQRVLVEEMGMDPKTAVEWIVEHEQEIQVAFRKALAEGKLVQGSPHTSIYLGEG